jgi:hypothetical protein
VLYRIHTKDFCCITLQQGVSITSLTTTLYFHALRHASTINRINSGNGTLSEQAQFELIHDQLPLAVPCYDLFPVTDLTVVPPYGEPSGTTGSLELTGGEYKTRERIHRSLADLRLLAIPTSSSRVADCYPN